jgi:hypothetical protein
MIRIALAVVATVGLTFAADAQIGPLCQTPDGTGTLVVCHSGRSQIGPLCLTPDHTLVVCRSGLAGGSGPLCQTPDRALVVCHSGRG